MKGFTLLELLVVIALMALVLVLALPNFKGIKTEQALKNTAAEIQSALRTAQNNASSGLKCDKANTPVGKWSFIINSTTSYTVKPDDPLCNSAGKEYDLSKSGVRICSVSASSHCDEPQPVAGAALSSLSYSNINATLSFSISSCPSANGDFIIKVDTSTSGDCDANNYKLIKVDSGGRIYVQ